MTYPLAIDVERLTSDMAIRCEEDNGSCHLLDLAEATDRNSLRYVYLRPLDLETAPELYAAGSCASRL